MSEDKAPAVVEVSKEEIEKHKTMAILAWIIFFIPLLTDAKDSKFAKFHANQSLLVTLIAILGSVLTSTVIGAIVGIPLSIVALVFWIMGILSAVNGQMKRIPIVGNIELIK